MLWVVLWKNPWWLNFVHFMGISHSQINIPVKLRYANIPVIFVQKSHAVFQSRRTIYTCIFSSLKKIKSDKPWYSLNFDIIDFRRQFLPCHCNHPVAMFGEGHQLFLEIWRNSFRLAEGGYHFRGTFCVQFKVLSI